MKFEPLYHSPFKKIDFCYYLSFILNGLDPFIYIVLDDHKTAISSLCPNLSINHLIVLSQSSRPNTIHLPSDLTCVAYHNK